MNQQEYLAAVLLCLAEGNKKGAAKLLWPKMVQNSQTDKIWDAMDKYPFLCIMGHGSASKSYTAAAWMLLDWWSHPKEEALIITSDTIPSMSRRIWSDIKSLWSGARIKMPGVLVDSRRIIKPDDMDEKNAIAGIAAESDDAQTKIQGVHTKYVRVVIDEADNRLSGSVWKAISNLVTSGDLRVVALANPFDISGHFGQHCEPIDGWGSVNPEVSKEWESRKGCHVLRLDGLDSPNLVAKEDIYPFLLTNKGVQAIKERAGENSAEYWSYVRGWFPPEGTVGSIFSKEVLDKTQTPNLFYGEKVPISSCDPAFEGGDRCIQMFGFRGRSAENPKKTIVEVRKIVTIKRQDKDVPITIDFAAQIVQNCKMHGVKPGDFILDGTGNALGLVNQIQHTWSKSIVPVVFSEGCTEMKITQEDSRLSCDRYDRLVSELWYSAREWCNAGLVYIHEPPRELLFELEARLYELKKNKVQIQSKDEMRGEGLTSPDMGDAFVLLIHLCRLKSNGFLPSTINAPVKLEGGGGAMETFKKKEFSYKADYGVPEAGADKYKSKGYKPPSFVWKGKT